MYFSNNDHLFFNVNTCSKCGCDSCKQCVKPKCGCSTATTETCSCVTPVAIEGKDYIPTTVAFTECEPVITCSEGCAETIKAGCVVLDEYCFVNDCNCADSAITLQDFINQICAELKNIKEEIKCLSLQVPACNGEAICTSPIINSATGDNGVITISWNPGSDNSGQQIYYRQIGAANWNLTSVQSATANTYTFNTLVPNDMYEFKVQNVCNGNYLDSALLNKFSIVPASFNISALSTSDIKISWGLSRIANIQSINISLYLGLTLVSTVNLPASALGNYVFSGLTTNTIYTIVYGLTYIGTSQPESTYTAGIGFLTTLDSQSRYLRTLDVKTL
jgi:hypothetical protein